MFVLGHVGITLGTAVLLNSTLSKPTHLSPKGVPEQSLRKHNPIRSLLDRIASQFVAL